MKLALRYLLRASILCISLSRAGAAQRGAGALSLRGIVRRTDGTPLRGVDVWLVASDRHTLTDSTGLFVLTVPAAGPHLLELRLIGYAALRTTAEVSAGSDTLLHYSLQDGSVSLDTVRSTAAARRYLSPSLQAFENRRLAGSSGSFVSDSVLRRNENSTLAAIVGGRIPGTMLDMGRVLLSARQRCRGLAFRQCPKADCYYANSAEAPPTMHSNDEGCGTLWLWTREK